ncbi:hypothetical protein HOY82DRAFT_578436 [Tuber indicum]|nr:hypothetical protein HOY82DRAFT_578436 [Tuber indicum]
MATKASLFSPYTDLLGHISPCPCIVSYSSSLHRHLETPSPTEPPTISNTILRLLFHHSIVIITSSHLISHTIQQDLKRMAPKDLILGLHRALEELTENPPPSVPSPEGTPKRASVALVVRVQPHPSHLPASIDNYRVGGLSEFFEQPWVKRGDPECLFIKRAARKGDRWTSHVALPGGKRDGEDEDDHRAAVRECLEEVGLVLDDGMIIDCGKLPDRVVNYRLMVLCPFVFLYTSPTAPSFTLQPTEVASAHWVPIRTLISPVFRTVQTCDVSDRLSRRFSGLLESIVRWGLRVNLGQMEFAAVRLWPSISIFSSFSGDFLDGTEAGGRSWDRPLLLWGLTLGVVTDFLEMLPRGERAAGWKYPTFTRAAWEKHFARAKTQRAVSSSSRKMTMALPAPREANPPAP